MENLKKIGCNNCGGELFFSPGTQMSTCNFCGSEFNIQEATDTEVKMVEKILPFNTSAVDFEIAALRWLSEGDLTPDDILEGSLFNNQVGVYLPMWVFDGRFDGSWSASSGYDRIEEYLGRSLDGKSTVTKTRTVTDWRPSNGNCKGDFQFLATASSENSIPVSVKVFSHDVVITKNSIKDFNADYTQGFSLLEIQLESEECWELYGKDQADFYVERTSKKRIPGDHYKDFYVDAVYDLNKNTSCYVPFWLRNYKYNTSDFHLYMDGTDVSRIDGERPIDEQRASVIKEIDRSRNIGCGIFACIAVLSVVLLSQENTDLGGASFWVIVIIGAIYVVVKEKEKKKIIGESKQIRKNKLEARISALGNGSLEENGSSHLAEKNSNTPSF
tara:strand:- start:1109 stop:2269 length:1161 start_codon:yes stop_codon:yes gene_type:complete